MKRLLCGILAMATMLSGCALRSGGETSSANGSGSAAVSSASQSAANISIDGDMTVYDCGGVQIALPTKYVDQLMVTTAFDAQSNSGGGTPLISVSEKASWEQSKADLGEDDGAGFLFGISRLDRKQYEQYIAGGRDGQAAFAVTGKAADDHYTAPVAEEYYVYSTATDVQFYRTGGTIDTNSQDWKNWEKLLDIGADVQTDMIKRNGLTSYSDDEFLNQKFTYTGDHAYVKYYPNFAADGTKTEYNTLVLSQPAKQGAGGIWCVERWYDGYGNCYIYFPSTDTMGGSESAAAYCAKLQKAADTGDQTFLTPVSAAVRFETESGYSSAANVTADSMEQVEGLDPDTGHSTTP